MVGLVRWHYLGSIALSSAFILGALLVSSMYEIPLVSAQAESGNVRGWAWSGTTGWVSLSNLNAGICQSVGQNCPAYGVTLTLNAATPPNQPTGGTLTGYAWSGALRSWVCFGSTCGGTTPAPFSSSPVANFTCKDESGNTAECSSAPRAEVDGWARLMSSGSGGWISLRKSVGGTGADYGVNITFAESQAESTTFDGFAWQFGGGNSPNQYGSGWLCFGGTDAVSSRCTSEVLFPYLQARGGDVFTRGGITTLFYPPANKYNAQYQIHMETLVDPSSRFVSNCPRTNPNCLSRSLDLGLPTSCAPSSATEPFRFKLGRFDFDGLGVGIGTTGRNKYNHELVLGKPQTNQPLGGKVYLPLAGEVDIDTPLQFANGAGNVSGAGLVIIRGNLNVKANLTYSSLALPAGSSPKLLPSLVWIVLGDVKIDPSVKDVAGTFIILGSRSQDRVCKLNPLTPCSQPADCAGPGNLCIPKCEAKAGGNLLESFGSFLSCYPFPGTTSTCATTPLVVRGSVFARQFRLDRTYVDVSSKAPSEQFWADGRLQLNPPPGMEDFSKGLPTFSRR